MATTGKVWRETIPKWVDTSIRVYALFCLMTASMSLGSMLREVLV